MQTPRPYDGPPQETKYPTWNPANRCKSWELHMTGGSSN